MATPYELKKLSLITKGESKEKQDSLSKAVIIRNMVRKEELANDIHIKQDIIDDIKEECKNIGISDIEDIVFNEENATVLVKFSKKSCCCYASRSFIIDITTV